ncbi:MAG: hypothetical protein ACO4AC_00955 [Pseudohongiellaceae bacterium]
MVKKKAKLSKKNRNTISGLLVGLASLYAISVYMEISREELRNFLTSTLLFFALILVLAILAISGIKLLSKLKQKLSTPIEDSDHDKDSE